MKKVFIVLMVTLMGIFAFTQVKNPDMIFDATLSEPDTLDPHHAYDTSSGEVIFNVYDFLIEYDGESLSEFVPMLSTVVPSVENGYLRDGGTTYVFPIREGVKFHNGNDLTAEDVEYTFERGLLYAPAGGPMWMFLDPLFGVTDLKSLVEDYIGASWDTIFDDDMNPTSPEYEEALVNFYYDVIDPAVEVQGNEVHVHLARPFAPFLNIVAAAWGWGAILDKEYSVEIGIWDGNAKGWWKYHGWTKEQSPYSGHAMGTGPYKLVEWDHAQQRITLERNDDYWRSPAPIRRVTIQGIPEWSTRRAMLETGDADIIDVPPQYLNVVKQMEGITVLDGLPALSLDMLLFTWSIDHESPYIGSGQLDGNGIPPDFFAADRNVRLGFAYAMDYDALINEILKGQGIRIPTAVLKGLLGFSEELPLYELDLQKAEDYFKSAYGGRLWNTGFKATMVYNVGNDTRRAAAEILRDNLAEINPRFQLEVRGIQWPTYLDDLENHRLPVYILGFSMDFPDPHNFVFNRYHSEGNTGKDLGKLYEDFANLPRPEFGGRSLNKMIEDAAAETDPVIREQMYLDIQEFIIYYTPNFPLAQTLTNKVTRSWVKGFIYNPMWSGDYYYNYTKAE